MQTIQDRGYVWKKGNSLVPSFIAFAVINLLEQHFAQLVDYDFTASLEEELDEIAGGTLQRVDWLTEFYFGGEGRGTGGIAESGGLKQIVGQRLEEIDARGVNSIPLRATGPDGVAGHRPGRPLRAVPAGRWGRRRPGEHPRGPRARRADQREGQGTPRGAVQRPRARHRPGVRAPGRRQGRALRPLRHDRRPRGQQGRAPDGQPLRLDGAGDADPRAGADAADAAAHGRRRAGRRGDPGAQRALRALPEEGHRLPLARRARTSCSAPPWRRRWRSSPSPSSGDAAPRPSRSRSSARTR